VGTAGAAFVGVSSRGPTNTPTLVASWSQYTSVFGEFLEGCLLARAVYGYFCNGGGACYVVRVGGHPTSRSESTGVPRTDVAPEATTLGNAWPPGPEVTGWSLSGADDFVGNPADGTGLGGLEGIDEVTMVNVPDLMSAYRHGLVDMEGIRSVQPAMIAHCERMGDRMAILDAPPGLDAAQVRQWRVDSVAYDSEYACLYWPWIEVLDPATGTDLVIPPGGHVTGVWGRNDDTRGVHKAPANEVVRGAIGLERGIRWSEHDLLNPVGINCIRSPPGRGIRVWGARTLSSDPSWRYLTVRRLVTYLEQSILEGTGWVVLEPNDSRLWATIRGRVSAFLTSEWRKGALFGMTPSEAFYVTCDEETNPPDVIAAGDVVFDVGVAPVKPSEFVTLRLSQSSARST
jgi:hypothetical protein